MFKIMLKDLQKFRCQIDQIDKELLKILAARFKVTKKDVFAKNNLNLTSLHSIPSRLRPWNYFFFLEVQISYYSPLIKKVLKKLKKFCSIIRIIGAS